MFPAFRLCAVNLKSQYGRRRDDRDFQCLTPDSLRIRKPLTQSGKRLSSQTYRRKTTGHEMTRRHLLTHNAGNAAATPAKCAATCCGQQPFSHVSFSVAILFSTLLLCTIGMAQDRYFPLHHRQPTGIAGRWSVLTHPQKFGYTQPVEIRLPSVGHVTYYQGSPQNAVLTQSPSKVGMNVGYSYRIRISGMPEFPGAELYPTIEILDRLHPPQGQLEQFPIPIELTADEIEIVLQDRMVTKVVYLEQPDLAAPIQQEARIRVEDLSPTTNLLQAADERGRPMAIVRIGGRIPDPTTPGDAFYSTSPLLIPPQ